MPCASRERVRKLGQADKALVAVRCERFIAEILSPRFMPRIVPSAFNYKVGLSGRWWGSRYRFLARYRSGFRENLGEEFDSPFAALAFCERYRADLRFDLLWLRHTGRWYLFQPALLLEDALQLLETEELLWPP